MINEETDYGDWLVVEWKLQSSDFPMELTNNRHEQQESTVRLALDDGSATVIACCQRRDDARILVKELRHRERQYRQLVIEAATGVLLEVTPSMQSA